jgi:hypothetical protein
LGGTKAHFPRLGGEHIAENPRLGAGLANTKVKASPIRTEAGRGFRGHAKDRNNGKVQKSQLLSVSYANDGEQERIWYWRSRRDSNPRYAFGAYNGLANRRLQPLGHSSASLNNYALRNFGSNRALDNRKSACGVR